VFDFSKDFHNMKAYLYIIMVTATPPSGYKVLDTIGDTIILSMRREVYDSYFNDDASWEIIIDGWSDGISARDLLSHLQK
jgi:hypothetical protein